MRGFGFGLRPSPRPVSLVLTASPVSLVPPALVRPPLPSEYRLSGPSRLPSTPDEAGENPRLYLSSGRGEGPEPTLPVPARLERFSKEIRETIFFLLSKIFNPRIR